MILGNFYEWKAIPAYYIGTILEPHYLPSSVKEWHWDIKIMSQWSMCLWEENEMQ